MFEPTSRYHPLETATYAHPDGRVLRYQRRRFLPQNHDAEVLALVTVTESDRLDLITARTIGDPQQFWRVCDANDVMNPVELTEDVGRVLRISMPQAQMQT